MSSRESLKSTLDAVAQGDQSALQSLYEQSSSKLYGIALRILRDPHEAEDVLQRVYLTVWQRAEQYDETRGGVMTWLSTITRNRSIDRIRQRSVVTAELSQADEIRDESPSPEALTELAHDVELLEACLGQLKTEHAQAIRHAFLDGITYSTLAEQSNVPLGTMKSWIRRSLLKLRECLER